MPANTKVKKPRTSGVTVTRTKRGGFRLKAYGPSAPDLRTVVPELFNVKPVPATCPQPIEAQMHTIRIKTKSTITFEWACRGEHGLTSGTAVGIRYAVVEAIDSFEAFVRHDGAHDGIEACLVTWEDGDRLHAFIFRLAGEIPHELPWILMRSKPERVLRASRG